MDHRSRIGELRAMSPEDRFWAKVDRRGPDECWEWLAALSSKGYGNAHFDDRTKAKGAHQISYELCVGPVPSGMLLDHTCHNRDQSCQGGNNCRHRRCVNPAHLEPVTALTNSRRGRNHGATHYRAAKVVA